MSDSEDSDNSNVDKNKRKFSRVEENRLNDSLRKGKPLQATYITVAEDDGNIKHLPINKDNHVFSNNPAILDSLKILGDIEENSAVSQPYQRQNKLRLQLNRSLNINSSVAPEMPPIEQMKPRTSRSGSFLTPNLIENLKKDRKRFINAQGDVNVIRRHVENKKHHFFKDLFTTMVDMSWRYVFTGFMAGFFVSWMIFTVLYYIVAIYRGDLEPQNLPNAENYTDTLSGLHEGKHLPCVLHCYDFTSYFLYSMESQHTIGYGSRATTERCPETIILVCLQSIIGVMISSCMAGVVFAKLARPKSRTHTVQFSKNAVITQKNNQWWLMFRVCNMRKSHLIEAHLRAQLIHHRKKTVEGEELSFECQELPITTQHTFDEDENDEYEPDDKTLLLFPQLVAHRIDEDSPFYSMGQKELLAAKFELLVTLEGVIESTGNSVQIRSSYLPNEILWGCRFENMVNYSKKRGTYILDCSALNQWEKDNITPPFSRKVFDEKLQLDKKTLTMLQDHHQQPHPGTGNNVTRVSLGENGLATTTESNGSSATVESGNPNY